MIPVYLFWRLTRKDDAGRKVIEKQQEREAESKDELSSETGLIWLQSFLGSHSYKSPIHTGQSHNDEEGRQGI